MDLKQTVKDYVDKHMQRIYQAVDMFNVYFGEQNVSFEDDIVDRLARKVEKQCMKATNDENVAIRTIQSCADIEPVDIIVRWPAITITNELGNTTDIYDLFGIVALHCNGRIWDITFKRTTYTKKQFESGYIHSHIPGFIISRNNENDIVGLFNYIAKPKKFCFGRGPINNTIYRMKTTAPTAEDYLMLCRELDICVRIESLEGIPYRKISEIGSGGSTEYAYQRTERWMRIGKMPYGFIRHFMKNAKFKYVFSNGQMNIGMPFNEFAIEMTREFIMYAKENNLDRKTIDALITEAAFDGTKIMVGQNQNIDIDKIKDLIKAVDVPIVMFKGTPYKIKFVNDNNEQNDKLHIVKSNFASYVHDLVTLVINSKTDTIGQTETERQNDTDIQCNTTEETDDEHETKRCSFIV